MRQPAAIMAMAALLAATSPALAQDKPGDTATEQQKRAVDLAREATEKFMKALEMLIQSIPQYGLPKVDKNGDIVIPRLPKEAPAKPETPPPPKEEGAEKTTI